MIISLSPELEDIVQSMLDSGRYSSPEELLQVAILRLWEQEKHSQQKFKLLQSEVLKGYQDAENGILPSETVE